MSDNRGQYHAVIVNGDINGSSSTNEFRFVNKDGHINVDYSTVGRLKYIHSNILLFIKAPSYSALSNFIKSIAVV